MFSKDAELKRIQIICLKLLNEFIYICENNNLTYFLSGGSLLGAIRHKGFIPWDDDIDIAMPRKDYDRLIEIANSLLPEHYELQHYSLANSTPFNTHHIQIVDKRTSVIKKWTINKKTISIWIDIFPLDGMPKSRLLLLYHYYKTRVCWLVMQTCWLKDNVDILKKRPTYQKLFIDIFKKLPKIKQSTIIHLMECFDSLAKKYDFNTSNNICSFHGIYGKKEILKKDWFSEKMNVEFEGLNCVVPEKYNYILKNYYGNYDIIPIEKEREQKHKYKIIKLR